jgi:predicted dehydrogenase
VAIIGLGIMGRRMLEHMVLHTGYKPVALWDLDPDACQNAQIIAPEAYALEAALANKSVFLEKPLGVDIRQSNELVAELEKSGVPAAVNFTQAAGVALSGVTEAARSGEMGDLVGVDIVVTYAEWPRDWQKDADWLKFRDEGGLTREVISHFLFFSERILGPLTVVWAHPVYPNEPTLCETQMHARLETEDGKHVYHGQRRRGSTG